MTVPEYRDSPLPTQSTSQLQEFRAKFANIDDKELLRKLRTYRRTGRTGHPLRGLWRAYLCTFLLNMRSTNDLIRELEDRPDLRIFCGLYTLPDRSTFNRFIRRLSCHADLVEQVLAQLTNMLKAHLPDLGAEVAIDSTAVRTHSNGNPDPPSDNEATWAPKNSVSSRGGKKVFYFGYKLHMVADVNYGLPLALHVTTGKRSDNPELPTSIEHAEEVLPWFKPRVAIADRGYDASSNHEYLAGKGILPIIHIREAATKEGLYEGIYTKEGVPTCMGQVPMRYVRTDPERGHLYRCVGCHLANRIGTHYCKDEVWEDPKRRPAAVWSPASGKRRMEEAVQEAASCRAGVQEHEGVAAAGTALRARHAPNHAALVYVGSSVSGYRTRQLAAGQGLGYALAGQKDHLTAYTCTEREESLRGQMVSAPCVLPLHPLPYDRGSPRRLFQRTTQRSCRDAGALFLRSAAIDTTACAA